MQSAKEAASSVAASAKSGMDKTKAVAQEKAEKMTTRDPLKKEVAEQKKDARINEAERMKHGTRAENVASRREHGHDYNATTGTGAATGYSTGTIDIPASGYSAEGRFGEDYPAGAHTAGTGRTGVQDPRVTGRRNTDNGSGATY